MSRPSTSPPPRADARRRRAGTLLQLVMLLRFQLAIGTLLVLLAPLVLAGGSSIRSLLGNLPSTDPVGLIFVALWSVFVAWAVSLTAQVTLRNIHRRVETDDLRRQLPKSLDPTDTRTLWWGALAAPLVAVTVARSHGPLGWRLAGAAAGVVIAVAVFRLGRWLTGRAIGAAEAVLLDGRAEHGDAAEPAARLPVVGALFDLVDRILARPPFGPGYVDPATGRARVGHRLALITGMLSFLVYAVVCVVFLPTRDLGDLHPALGYVLVVMLVAAWALPGAAFLLDRWRVPVLLSLIPYLLLTYVLARADHYFVLDPKPPGEVARLAPADTLGHWIDHDERGAPGPLVVVATSGGGITAAAWTAEILSRAEQQIGAPFVRSLHAVSSVSGGGVGVVHYLSGFERAAPRGDEMLQRIRDAAAAPSLPAAAWGIAYPDLTRVAAPFVMRAAWRYDRAWAMERSWMRRLVAGNASDTLLGWRARVSAGELPLPLINATVADTGERFLITPADLPESGPLCAAGCSSFLDAFAFQDVSIITAARLSATFPWVTPMARRERGADGPEYHIADGGYFDNLGVETALEWLDAVLPAYLAAGGRRVLLVRIEASPPEEPGDEPPSAARGSLYSSFGPVMTLLAARTATQRFRTEKALDEFRGRWTEHRPDDGCLAGADLGVVSLVLDCRAAPLSWQLDDDERRCIEDAWARVTAGDDWRTMVEFFAPG